jgi:hypothetical protein
MLLEKKNFVEMSVIIFSVFDQVAQQYGIDLSKLQRNLNCIDVRPGPKGENGIPRHQGPQRKPGIKSKLCFILFRLTSRK